MPALYAHTTRASGTVLTATIYNADHQNHIDNGVPLQHDDYSTNATQMQTTTDPGETGSESLATTQAGEFERLRFAIKEAKQCAGASVTHWYNTPAAMASVYKAPVAKSSTFAITNADKGVLFDCTGTYDVTFSALSTFDAEFFCTVINTGTGVITLNPSASELIEGPGGANGGDLTFPLCYTGSVEGPYNTSGVVLYKKSATVFGVQATRTAHGSQVFTASSSWTCPEGVFTAWISGCGGGGGGGGCTANVLAAAGGGASGAAALKQAAACVPGTVYTVTIGAGGAGGGGGAGGVTGGTTSVGAIFSKTGGTGGGLGPSGSIGAGGSTGFALGGDGILADFAGGQKAIAWGGQGAGNFFSAGQKGNAINGGVTNGNASSGYGGGGSGAASTNGAGAAVTGGNGSAGIVIIDW